MIVGVLELTGFFQQVQRSFISDGDGSLYWLAVIASGLFVIWMLHFHSLVRDSMIVSCFHLIGSDLQRQEKLISSILCSSA